MRSTVPSVGDYRRALVDNGSDMLSALREWRLSLPLPVLEPTVLDVGLPGLGDELRRLECRTPRLLLTSPPYPGVYVIYHRWKLRGRREIPAPYWITGHQDGNGISHYTMGARAEPTLNRYFSQLELAFRDLVTVISTSTVVVQMVGFSDASDQLARYLQVMRSIGLQEFTIPELATEADGRLWRSVPNRRWWTEARSKRAIAPHTSREVVLLHRLAL
jgi:hypothetical protein